MRGYADPDSGYRWDVSRLLSVALVVVVAAGCGSAVRTQRTAGPRIPRALARAWEGRASGIAAAAAAGHECRALRLATSLRDEVVATDRKLPLRLRSPLETGVKALAGRIACVPRPGTAPTPEKRQKPPHQMREGRDRGHGRGGGDGNEQ